MKNLIKYLFALVLLTFSTTAFAQSIYSIKLNLTDAKTSEPVAFATASVTVKGEKSPLKYTLSDDKGEVNIPKLKKGTYILKAELMGYKTFIKEVVLEHNLNLGTVKLEEDAEVLDAARVSDVGNPIVIKKDTVEYNASSFKTSDNDMLEQLLKKLPGIEIGSDGSITANGETIKKITIDGKTFFLDDPQLASKNIPAKLIEKVKVVEKKSDQAMFTGIDDGEEETIIDLKLRPGMAQGWFGNVMGGGGHDVPGAGSNMDDWRYQGAAMIGRFTDKAQISLILNGNNTNNRGFNDVAGSMMGNMRGGRGMGGRAGGGPGGMGGNDGISTTWMGGVNGAFSLCDGDMDLAANYLYNGSDKDVIENTSQILYYDDRKDFNNTYGVNNTFTQGHRFGVRLEHKFSENTSILFEPQFNFGKGSFNEQSVFDKRSLADGATDTLNVNNGYSSNLGWNDNWSTSGFLLFRQRLGKPGRTISANIRYSFSNNNLDGFNQSLTNVYDKAGQLNETGREVVNQRFVSGTQSMSVNGRAVYTEPLTQYLFLEANYEYNWSHSNSQKNTYDSFVSDDSGNQIYQDENKNDRLRYLGDAGLNENYSNAITNTGIAQKAGLSLSYQKKKFRAQIGAAINPTTTINKTVRKENPMDTTIKVINWSPQAMLTYEFNDNTNLRMFYFGRSSQPSTSQLMPVLDNSNPQSLTLGNPYLQPYFNHNIRARFGYTNKQTFTSVNANIRGTIVQNAITSAQWTDSQNRIEYSLPVNGPSTKSVNGNIFLNTPFAKSNFSIFSMTLLNYNQSYSYIGTSRFEDTMAAKYYNKEEAEFDYAMFQADFPDLNERSDMFTANTTRTFGFMQRLRLTYRNDFVELNLGGRTNMSKSWYTLKDSQRKPTWSNSVDGSMNWTIPGGINLIAEANYNWYNGQVTPIADEIILNAEITKLLFKNKFTLALKAYDILGQSKNLSVSDASNYHLETTNNTLGRYIILSLTYRFGKFKGAKGGPQGGPGGPGPGMGGRPGGFGGPPRF